MNRLSLVCLIAIATIASFMGSLVINIVFGPLAAQAQDSGPPPAAMEAKGATPKIAVLDLETLARESAVFAERRVLWQRAERATKEDVRLLQSEIDGVKRELARKDAEDPEFLRKQIELLEESMVTLKSINKRYLDALLEEYQTDVLEHVLSKAERYCAEHGFELLLQSYDRANVRIDQQESRSQRTLNQTVLWTLREKEGTDRVVIDITAKVK